MAITVGDAVDRASAVTVAALVIVLGRRQAQLAQALYDRLVVERGETAALVALRASLDQLQATLRHGEQTARRMTAGAAPLTSVNRTGR